MIRFKEFFLEFSEKSNIEAFLQIRALKKGKNLNFFNYMSINIITRLKAYQRQFKKHKMNCILNKIFCFLEFFKI